MKANELMIGDWVKPSCWNEQVLLVGERRITVKSDSYTEDEIKPIALTAEILEKNGFNKTPLGSWHWGREDNITLTEEPLIWWLHIDSLFIAGEVSLAIESVHELQHALRLFGIQKEIVL